MKRRRRGSKGLPHTFDLLLAHLEVVSISGEDFEGDGFIILGHFKLLDHFFEIDHASTDRKMAILLPEVVMGMDMANSVTMEADKL